jgi:hypothetical protein
MSEQPPKGLPLPKFASSYIVRDYERRSFGKAWVGPDSFPHGDWTLVAQYTAKNPDGKDASVHCSALPVRSYSVRTTTGSLVLSDVADLAATLAEAISDGSFKIESPPSATKEGVPSGRVEITRADLTALVTRLDLAVQKIELGHHKLAGRIVRQAATDLSNLPDAKGASR